MTARSTPAELVAQTRLSGLIPALGGSKVIRGRTTAFYRGGDNPTSLSIDDSRGVWQDFVAAKGGGVLDLIQEALGCTRREAAEWLASYHGTTLDRQTPAQARRWRGKYLAAKAAADELLAWRQQRVRELIGKRNRLVDDESFASAAARTLLQYEARAEDEWAWDFIWAHASDHEAAEAVQEQLDRFEAATPRALIVLRQAERRRPS